MKQSFALSQYPSSKTLSLFLIFSQLTFILFLSGCGSNTPSSRYDYEYPDSSNSSYQDQRSSSRKNYDFKGVPGDVFVSPRAKNSVYQKVAVMAFKAPREIVGASISDMFTTELLKTYKYELIERNQIEQILDEQVLSLKGVTDSQLAVKVGKILGVDGVLVGTVPEFGYVTVGNIDLPSVGINVRMIDVQTGTIVWSVSNSAISKQPANLSAFARELIKMSISGLIIELVRNGDTIGVHLQPPYMLDIDAGIRQNIITIRNDRNDGYAAYNFLRSRRKDGSYRIVATIEKKKHKGKSTITFKDTNLLDAETYYYKLAGVMRSGLTSKRSKPIIVTTVGAPAGVRSFQAANGALREVALTWAPSRSSVVKGYTIYRSTSANGPFDKIIFLKGKDKDAYVDKGKKGAWSSSTGTLKDSTKYFYTIRSVNTVDVESPDSVMVSAVTTGPPRPLKGVAAQGGFKKMIRLSWYPVKSNIIKGYAIYRSESPDDSFKKITSISGKKSHKYEDKGTWQKKLDDNTEYFYKIYTVNIVNVESPDAVVVSAVTKPVPVTVVGIHASQDEARKVSLSWQKNPEKDIYRYEVFRGESSGNIKKRVKQLKSDQVTYTDTKLDDGTTYYYMVRAVDRDDLIGPFSKIVQSTTKPIPIPPAGLTAAYDDGKIMLSWEANPEDDIVKYEVFTEGIFGSSKTGETGDTSTSITKGVKPGKTLRIKIKAVDSTKLISEFSNVVSVTIPE